MNEQHFANIELAENPEPRCPCVLLLDVSGSMMGRPIAALNKGLKVYRDELVADALAAKRVEVAVVTFGKTVSVNQPFQSAMLFQPPLLVAEGETPMGKAIETALALLQERKSLYRNNGIMFYRPWLVLITDGAPTDMYREAAALLKQGEQGSAFSFFAIGVPGATFSVLNQLSSRPPLRLEGLRFAALFQWLSNSQRSVSRSSPGDKVRLEDPTAIGEWAADPTRGHADVLDVAVTIARCSKANDQFRVRVEQREAGWFATDAERWAGDSTFSERSIPGFDFAPDYPGCPSCHAALLFKCTCGRIGCLAIGSRSVRCSWCQQTGAVGGRAETIGGGAS